jgi:hypothetical protein
MLQRAVTVTLPFQAKRVFAKLPLQRRLPHTSGTEQRTAYEQHECHGDCPMGGDMVTGRVMYFDR